MRIATGMLMLIFFLSVENCLSQERTTFMGDTSLFGQIRIIIGKTTDSIRQQPGNAALYFRRGSLLFDIEEWKNAEADLSKAISIDTAAEFYYRRGSIYERLSRLSDAYDDFTKVIEMNPTYEMAWLDRGLILEKLKMHKEATSDFRHALTLKPVWGFGLFCMGNNHHNMSQIDSAEYYYKQAIACDNTTYKAYNNLGVIYKDQKKFDLAIDQFNKAISVWNRYLHAIVNRAETKFMKGDKTGACLDVQMLIDMGYKEATAAYRQFCR